MMLLQAPVKLIGRTDTDVVKIGQGKGSLNTWYMRAMNRRLSFSSECIVLNTTITRSTASVTRLPVTGVVISPINAYCWAKAVAAHMVH
jgi:hypothetical protein